MTSIPSDGYSALVYFMCILRTTNNNIIMSLPNMNGHTLFLDPVSVSIRFGVGVSVDAGVTVSCEHDISSLEPFGGFISNY